MRKRLNAGNYKLAESIGKSDIWKSFDKMYGVTCPIFINPNLFSKVSAQNTKKNAGTFINKAKMYGMLTIM